MSTPTDEARATTNRATLTVELVGDLSVVTGDFSASGPVIGSTSKLASASGTLAFDGVQDLADPLGSLVVDDFPTIDPERVQPWNCRSALYLRSQASLP
jgi:hypothetical protein